ncbi:MAG: efflux RND transporter periplasmic adaptor subunit [Desulfotalea sp.]
MKKRFASKYLTIAAVTLSLSLPLTNLASAEGPPPGPPQAFPVSAIDMKKTKIQYTKSLPARTVAYKVAEIRPQVTGIVKERLFIEGKKVNKGDKLYLIDPAPYQAIYDSAKADLMKTQANLRSITAKNKRYSELVKINAVSRQEYDDVHAQYLQARASIAVAQASLASAEINLNYTNVYAPISGIIGKSNVTEGALVTANQSNLLAQITQLDPIYVDIQGSSVDALTIKKRSKNTDEIKVDLNLGDAYGKYEHQGILQFSEVTVDPTTSSVQLRALFSNPEQLLFPGLFTKATLLLDFTEVFLVPQKAIIRGFGNSVSAWIIDDKGLAQPATVTLEGTYGNNYIVSTGIKEGDNVITAGFQKIRQGSPVVVDNKTSTEKKQ